MQKVREAGATCQAGPILEYSASLLHEVQSHTQVFSARTHVTLSAQVAYARCLTVSLGAILMFMATLCGVLSTHSSGNLRPRKRLLRPLRPKKRLLNLRPKKRGRKLLRIHSVDVAQCGRC